ncbi:diacylglycerol kinase (ATP) [Azospirillaceae bacterium]
MKIAVVLNETAGALHRRSPEKVAAWIRERLEAWDHQVTITTAAGGLLTRAIRQAINGDAEVVAIGGGDGTISAAARQMIGAGKCLGVLPMGTINLFARDLGIPRELDAAISVIARGRSRMIDVGEVNGHIFLNNSVIGLYPSLIRVRERHRQARGLLRWASVVLMALRAVWRARPIPIRLECGQGSQFIMAAALAVANNPAVARRSEARPKRVLDGGRLGVFWAPARARIGLLRLMARLALGCWRLDADIGYQATGAAAVECSSHRRVKVALDGEVFRLTPPLLYKIRPSALKVMAPEGSERVAFRACPE